MDLDIQPIPEDERIDTGEPKKHPQGRKRKDIDVEDVLRLARIGCTTEEMGKFFGVDGSQIRRRWPGLLDQARAASKARLRQAQFDLAINGDKTMLIWLGKQYLQQSETGERNSEERQPLPWSDADIPQEYRIQDEINETTESDSAEQE